MREFEDHIQWSTVKEVTSRLKEVGYQAFLAGGCVRDLLMNREPNDFDIATDATPDQVAALYPKALLVGRQFGVTILPYPQFQLEVATFRQDLEYKDGRRPEGVKFSGPEEDAKRRDFTVNALFYDLEENKVIDYVGGRTDLAQRLLRTVGDPDLRFGEDQLRLLRAVRFAAQLEFEIAPATLTAIERLADRVNSVSRERVRDEIYKLLKAPARVRGLTLLISTGLLRALFPKLQEAILGKEEKWLQVLGAPDGLSLSASLALFFAPFFEKESELRAELKNLRLDNRQTEAILFAARSLPTYLRPRDRRRGEIALLLSHPESAVAEQVASRLESLERDPAPREQELATIAQQSLRADRQRPAPLLTGEDLKAENVPAGPAMGKYLGEALLLQLEGALRTPDEARAWLRDQIK